jgi:NADPH-dependent glutamate synthase beta subunit-like oxidoreductase
MTDNAPAEKRVAMRQIPAEQALQSFVELSLGYSRDEAIAEARRAAVIDLSSAAASCPMGVDIAGFVAHIARGDFTAAHALILEAHPWPGILGRYCQKLCERNHSLGTNRESLNIGGLERAAAEHGAASRAAFRAGAATGKRIAILGAGSSGSAAAYRLRRDGHAVTLFDQLPVAGGMMAAGYPEFRLPMAVVQRENDLAAWGVELRLGTPIDRPLVETALTQFDAVIAATGKFKAARLDVPGETLSGVWDALDLLARLKNGGAVKLGAKVAVFGAGYSAQDAARAARRLGAAATIYYRRTRDDMPVSRAALPRYMAQMEAENVPYVFQAAPLRILGDQGRVIGVECIRTRPGDPDSSGRAAFLPVPGSEFTVACDTIIAATGESAELSFLPAGIRLTDQNLVWINPETFATSVPKLYAAGSLTGTASTVAAFKSGFDCAAALSIAFR